MMKRFRYKMYDLRSKATYLILTNLRYIFVWEHLLLFDLALPAHIDTKTHPVAYAKLADTEDIRRLANQFGKFQRGLADKRINQGNLCFLAYVGEKIAHYRWIALGETEMEAQPRAAHIWKVRIDSNSAYSFDAYTVPEHRGLGLGPFVFREAIDYLNKRQVTRLYAIVDKNNWPSIIAVTKEGYRLVGEIVLRRILTYRSIEYKAQRLEDQQILKKMLSFKV